ncbi:salivaricin M family lantibiotic [uncultured Streptococcus sp.]|uniref:salivaricin M family lantibiotic n=1 Tax=uncultured Streptococcus sp. TaxID=83427 RepID=UPI0009B883EE|nr:salivaricin M family lantibiotic [Streptococcus mitis]
MQTNQDNFEIDSLDYGINSQELDGKSVAGWCTAVRLTAQGRCAWWFAYSYEYISPNVRCG